MKRTNTRVLIDAIVRQTTVLVAQLSTAAGIRAGLTGDITLHPGVTCMNSFSADVLVNGHVYLDAGGNADAFFIIRGNDTLTVADGAQVILMNNARTAPSDSDCPHVQ